MCEREGGARRTVVEVLGVYAAVWVDLEGIAGLFRLRAGLGRLAKEALLLP